ncbi:hypothetical protein UFOVP257_17 [uncultured Caudovirales phage]|uniref:Uncharacterized protein n=1 Tax=uncultured Caudovirales phage TaxID=2100421 RepID=A0A6J5LFQ0_9CAUD|nr:hypothetical protein UFOVP257_17 [uncultured Caudovirales phage]
MAHFAELGENNVVLRVIVVADKDTSDDSGTEVEEIGANFCRNLLGGTWKKTSYNANIRKNYAGIGFTYDSNRDAFIPPKPFASWVLDEETCRWNPPVAMPTDGQLYIWNEVTQSWDAVPQ